MQDFSTHRLVALLAFSLFLTLFVGCFGDPKQIRHVVVLSFDTARPDHFGFDGKDGARTPNLDAFADASIVFTDAMVPAPTTLASHTSLLTGKYPHHHGVARNGFSIHPKNVLLTETLKKAGFHTIGFAGSFALDGCFGFTQGFDHWDDDFDILKSDAEEIDQNQRHGDEVTDTVLAHLDEIGVPDRLFLFAHYFDPHDPYTPEPGFVSEESAIEQEIAALRELRRDGVKTDQERRAAERYAARYADEIAYLDHHVGRLFDALEERGILEHAAVVITSDHGETFWEHKEETFNHGTTVYQSAIRALWVMRLPGEEGRRIDRPVGTIDILPTLLDRLGLPIPEGIDGQVVPISQGAEPTPNRALFSQATKPWRQVETDPHWRNSRKARMVREGRYKFIQIPYRKREALFDLEADPGEQTNLLANPSAEIDALAEGLRARLESWAESADPLPSQFVRRRNNETIRRLQSLGYLQ